MSRYFAIEYFSIPMLILYQTKRNNGLALRLSKLKLVGAMSSDEWREGKKRTVKIDNGTHWNVFDCKNKNKWAKKTREFNTIFDPFHSTDIFMIPSTSSVTQTNERKKVNAPYVCVHNVHFSFFLVSKSMTYYIVCLAVFFSAAIRLC